MTTVGSRTTLVAVTRPLNEPADLLASVQPGDFFFKRNGTGLVASGWAGSVPVADVPRVLTSIEVDDAVRRRGTGAIAVGALPFAEDGRLRIPRRTIGVDPVGSWVTDLVADTPDVEAHNGHAVPEHVLDRNEWDDAVRAITDAIGRGDVDKVVLSRRVVVDRDPSKTVVEVIRALAVDRPDAWVYADGDFVGVSPELLVARAGSQVRSQPMAGTVAAEDADALLTSPRLVHEFQMVVDAIVAILGPRCGPLDVSTAAPVRAGNVSHLSSTVQADLTDPAPSALDIALELHPTPAVGGLPLDPAIRFIEKLEPAGRGRYAGPVGWVDAAGDGEFAVALRCAELIGSKAVLYAGNGIVAGSTPNDEWDETEAKLVAMRDVLRT